MPITYEALTSKHPSYDELYWEKIRILYEGAKSLRDALATPGPLREALFKRHLGEDDEVYNDRCRDMCYAPHMTQLIDYILSVLFSDPVKMSADGEGEDKRHGSTDPFYEDFFANTARPGSPAINFNQLLRELAKNSLLYKRTWVLIDFPKRPTDADGNKIVPQNRLEEEALKLDRAYCVPILPDDVYDWEYDEDSGRLLYVVVHNSKQKRGSVDSLRDRITETFTVYTDKEWTRYTYEYKPSKPPRQKQEPDHVETGAHTFGCVPVVPVDVPEGLWAGGKMESLALEIFNARSALSWGRNRSLFQMIVAKLGNPDPMNPVTEDTDRGMNQVVGPGRVITMGKDDAYDFVGPDVTSFAEARADVKDLVDDLHRVLHQLAQSSSANGGKQKQSGESKQMDRSDGAIVSKELGRVFRDVATVLLNVVSCGRKEDKEWAATGLSEFDDVKLDDFVNEAAVMETVPIPSPLFQTEYKFDLATRLLPGLTDEQKAQIYAELEAAHTAEAMIDDAKNDALLNDPLMTGGDPSADAEGGKAEGEGEKAEPKKPPVEAPKKAGAQPGKGAPAGRSAKLPPKKK